MVLQPVQLTILQKYQIEENRVCGKCVSVLRIGELYYCRRLEALIAEPSQNYPCSLWEVQTE